MVQRTGLDRAATLLRGSLVAAALLVACGAAQAQSTDELDYPNVFGPSTPTPLPNVPGRGVWNPTIIPNTYSGMTTLNLYTYLQREPTAGRPDRSSETPGLWTKQQQEAKRRALKAEREAHEQAMQERLQRDRR